MKAQAWQKFGRILAPDATLPWLATHAGASFGLPRENSSVVDIYVSGRDDKNRSAIGRFSIDLRKPTEIISIEENPILTFGDLGAFDENGVSYPWVVRHESDLCLFYTGWMLTVLTPFQNHLGLAKRSLGGKFERVSRAPILSRNNEDYLSIGSASVLKEGDLWRMWYTSFLSWGRDKDAPKHEYVIKYAESTDGTHWHRSNQTCIGITHKGEHSIGRPSILKLFGHYHLWYCFRGESYRIGYAVSKDGVSWQRKDDLIDLSAHLGAWESNEQCYPHVFQHNEDLYLLYSGNGYGQGGLGLARLHADNLTNPTHIGNF